MAHGHLLRHVSHRPDHLLSMVADVERYPDFIPLISVLRITSQRQLSDQHEQFEAEAKVSFKLLSEHFSSLVDLYHEPREIHVKKAGHRGAVKSLRNIWKFHELKDGSTLVEFQIDVRLKIPMLDGLLQNKFDTAGAYIMGLFERRADQLFSPLPTSNISIPVECQRLGLTGQLV